MPPYVGMLANYGHLLNLPAHTRRVTILEGNTPLFPTPTLATAISEAQGRGAKTVICGLDG